MPIQEMIQALVDEGRKRSDLSALTYGQVSTLYRAYVPLAKRIAIQHAKLDACIAAKRPVTDEGSWYDEQSRSADEFRFRLEIARLESAPSDEIWRLEKELESARYVGD